MFATETSRSGQRQKEDDECSAAGRSRIELNCCLRKIYEMGRMIEELSFSKVVERKTVKRRSSADTPVNRHGRRDSSAFYG
jgi:hypothetical protein